jgi:hypothetical protein
MEKSTKILIGVGVVSIVGLLVYKKAKAAPSLTNSGTIPKKPITKPSVPSNPIIDPDSGKLTPADPYTNPKGGGGSGSGSGSGSGGSGGAKGGGGSAGGPNNPDLNSGKFNKVDPNKKDENWIKALQKKQNAGSQKGKKPTPKVDCSANPYDPTCQKVKDCYYSPSDPACSNGEYDYSYGDDSGYNYSGYDNNKYDYSYDDGGYDYSGGGGGYYGGPSYYSGYYGDNGYFYSGNYGYNYSGIGGGGNGRGGNPSDFSWYWS